MDDSFEARLQVTLNVIPVQAWYAASTGALTFVNERTADYLGLPTDHPLRFGVDIGAAWDSLLALLHPEDHDETRQAWSNCLKTGSAAQLAFRVRNAQGGYRWFIGSVEPLRGSDGKLLYWIGVNVDIEERKQAEFYLAEGQRLAHTGSWTFDANGFEYWSSGLFEIHGLKPGGKAPTTLEYIALVHPEDREFVAQEIQKMIENHGRFDFTKRIVRPDGAMRYVRCVGTPATNGCGFVGTGIDVTEQEDLTQALRRSEEKFKLLVDGIDAQVSTMTPLGDLEFVNQQVLDYFGKSWEELKDWRSADSIAENDIPSNDAALRIARRPSTGAKPQVATVSTAKTLLKVVRTPSGPLGNGSISGRGRAAASALRAIGAFVASRLAPAPGETLRPSLI
jgi:PAS domain S-box-containing protein